ncbi:MAG: hypothetical protein AAF438_08470 [Pseudomonadota bacterium]
MASPKGGVNRIVRLRVTSYEIPGAMEVRIDTPQAFLRHQHRLMAYCRYCERRAEISLLRLISCGKGDVQIAKLKPRCRRCGAHACKQVVPPSPVIDCERGYGAV